MPDPTVSGGNGDSALWFVLAGLASLFGGAFLFLWSQIQALWKALSRTEDRTHEVERDGLRNYATKDDIRDLRQLMTDQHKQLRADLERMVTNRGPVRQ